MNPTFLILYVVVVTLLLTLLIPRIGELGPRAVKILRTTALVGSAVLVVLVVLTLLA